MHVQLVLDDASCLALWRRVIVPCSAGGGGLGSNFARSASLKQLVYGRRIWFAAGITERR